MSGPIRGEWTLAALALSTAAPAFVFACSPDDEVGARIEVPEDGATPTLDAASDAVTVDVASDPNCPPSTNDTPRTLACTALYEDLGTKRIAEGVREFRPAYQLWSDGADKVRWIYLPPGATIDTTDPGEWKFPIGTKLWKEFRVAGHRVETRFFHKLADTFWVHASYAWTSDELEANRVDGADLVVDGSAYHIPTPSECDKCHSGRRDRILGFEALSLGLPGAAGLTLAELAKEGRLEPAPTATAFAIGDDGSGNAAAALGWLHINCGVTCHNGNTTAEAYPTGLRLRLDPAEVNGGVPGASWDVIDTSVGIGAVTPRWSGQLRITPGYPDYSLLVALVSRRGTDQMPPLGTFVVDDKNVQFVRDWIASMPNDGSFDAGARDGGGPGARDGGADSGDGAGDGG